jgi:hypothetical protein
VFVFIESDGDIGGYYRTLLSIFENFHKGDFKRGGMTQSDAVYSEGSSSLVVLGRWWKWWQSEDSPKAGTVEALRHTELSGQQLNAMPRRSPALRRNFWEKKKWSKIRENEAKERQAERGD